MATVWVYFYLGIVAYLVAIALIPLCKALSKRFGLVDNPDSRKTHAMPIPLLGGLAFFVSFNAVIAGHVAAGELVSGSDRIIGLLPELIRSRIAGSLQSLPQLTAILAGGLAFFLIGLLDDKRALSARNRLLFEFLAVGAVIAAGLRFELGFLPAPLAMVITAVWIVGIANAFNLLDGLDGLAGGVAVICSCILGVVMIRGGQPLMAMFLAVLVGSAAGFLRHNFPPASIFMGSSGSLFLGYLISASAVSATFKIQGASAAFPILMPVLLLSVPLYDTSSVVFIRLKEHRNIFQGDRRHAHHRLVAAGFSEKTAVFFLWIMTFMTGIGAVLLVTADLWNSILIFSQVVVAFALIVLVKHVRFRTSANQDAKPLDSCRDTGGISGEPLGGNPAAGGETEASRVGQ